MSGVTDLARHIKERDNPSPYTPMIGKIISLPEYKIQLGDQVTLTRDNSEVKFLFDIAENIRHDGYTEYIHLNKEVVLLPYANDNKFIAIGVIL